MSFLDSAPQSASKLTPPPSFEQVVGSAREQREKTGAQLEQSEKDFDTSVAKLDKTAENKPPEFQQVPPPEPTETSPTKVWGSAAMLLTAIGSAFTRRPMVTAMNAAAKVINGFKQGDLEASQQAFATWKASNDNAIKAHQFQIDQYKEALDLAKEDIVAGSAKMRALASQFQDSYMLEASQTRSYQGMLDKYNEEEAKLGKLKEITPDLELKYEEASTKLGQFHDLKNTPAFINAGPQQRAQMVQDVLKPKTREEKDPTALKWEVLTDPKTNTQFRYNPETAQATTLDGRPYKPSSAARLGAQAGAKGAAQQKAQVVEGAYTTALDEIDKAITMAQSSTVPVSGAIGFGRRMGEGALDVLSGGNLKSAPAQQFETQITQVRDSIRNLLALGKYMSPGALEQMEKLVRGTGIFDTRASTVDSLRSLKQVLETQHGIARADESANDLSNLSDDELRALMQQNGIQ